MFWLKVVLYSMILVLTGCGGDSAPNNDNSGGLNGGDDIEITPPTIPPSSEIIRAMDFSKRVDVNPNIEQVNINLSIFVSSLPSEEITLESIAPVSLSELCQVLDVNETMLQFSISPRNASGCIYKYTVSNGFEFASGYANITVSAPLNGLQNQTKNTSLAPFELPSFEYNMSLGDELNINLVTDGVVNTDGMVNPRFSESVVTYGNGNATLQESGQFVYEAISVGTTLIHYYILDDLNTFSSSDDVIYHGKITISVSGNNNVPPTTLKDIPPIELKVGEDVDLDILAYPTEGGDISLISDVDGDELQLIFVSADNIDAHIDAVDLNNIKNTKLKIKGIVKGSFTIDYVVYDHNRDGVAHGQIPVYVSDSLSGKVKFFLEGYVKLFTDGTLGVVPNSTSYKLKEIIADANNKLAKKGLKATNILSVGMGLFWVQTDSPRHSLIIGTQRADLLEDVKTVYGKSFYSQRQDANNIAFILFNDNHVESYAQNYYMSSSVLNDLPDAFNNLPLNDRSDVKKITYYTFELIKIEYNNGSQRVLSLNNTSDLEWFENNPDKDKKEFATCLINNTTAQMYYYRGVDTYLTINTNGSQCEYLTAHTSVESNFKKLSSINKEESIVDLMFDQSRDRPTAVLTKKRNLWVAKGYKNNNLWERISENVVDFSANRSSVVYRLSDGTISIKTYATCVYGMKSLTEDGSSECEINGADISPKLDKAPSGYEKNVQFYKLSGDVIGLLYNDGSLAFISARGYKKEPGTYSWLIADENFATTGDRFDKPIWYQGNNLFAAYNLTLSKWEIFNPLEGWNGEFQCVPPSNLDDENIVDAVIMSGMTPSDGTEEPCPIYLFKNNGTQLNSNLTSLAYPMDRFSDSEYYSPLPDIDNDGISNTIEKKQCQSPQISIDKKHHHYWCETPALADSDFDDVNDAFENEYSTGDNLRYLSDSSHLMFEPLHIAPKDAFKDMNGNDIEDWLE